MSSETDDAGTFWEETGSSLSGIKKAYLSEIVKDQMEIA